MKQTIALTVLLATTPSAQTVSKELFRTTYHGTDIIVMQGDLLTQQTDAVVNAANESLIGAAGVAKAIQDAAGEKQFKAYVMANIPVDTNGERCPIGQARITPAFDLTKKYGTHHIIHTVGPREFTAINQSLLQDAYTASLTLAHTSKLSSITFPAISTGIFGYPLDKAAQAAAMATVQWVTNHPGALRKIVFAVWTDPNAQQYGTLLIKALQKNI